ncbi:hypothetical protein ACJX0J_039771 [Zea mays]
MRVSMRLKAFNQYGKEIKTLLIIPLLNLFNKINSLFLLKFGLRALEVACVPLGEGKCPLVLGPLLEVDFLHVVLPKIDTSLIWYLETTLAKLTHCHEHTTSKRQNDIALRNELIFMSLMIILWLIDGVPGIVDHILVYSTVKLIDRLCLLFVIFPLLFMRDNVFSGAHMVLEVVVLVVKCGLLGFTFYL